MASSPDRVVMIGVAGDSGCGKSTFLRRLGDLFGRDLITTICLDDYHSLDRYQRKEKGITALDPRANNFDLMYEQAKALKNGQSVMKPIYNHETGMIDPPELVEPNRIIVLEGLHPMYDERVRELLDFKVYLDLAPEIKIAWKVKRDMAERGHTYEDVLRSIEARRPDFEAYVDVQKQYADAVIEVLPTQLLPELDPEHKVLRVRLIQREGVKYFDHVYLFDEGSTIDWIPCGKKADLFLSRDPPPLRPFHLLRSPSLDFGDRRHLRQAGRGHLHREPPEQPVHPLLWRADGTVAQAPRIPGIPQWLWSDSDHRGPEAARPLRANSGRSQRAGGGFLVFAPLRGSLR
jgi:uridine kinase